MGLAFFFRISPHYFYCPIAKDCPKKAGADKGTASGDGAVAAPKKKKTAKEVTF